jgi:hypothetical protein
VVELDVLTTLDIDPERILNRALAEEPESILVVGWSKDGSLYFDRSMASLPEALWLMEMAKKILLDASFEG